MIKKAELSYRSYFLYNHKIITKSKLSYKSFLYKIKMIKKIIVQISTPTTNGATMSNLRGVHEWQFIFLPIILKSENPSGQANIGVFATKK